MDKETIKLLSANAYLQQFEPELKAKLEKHLLRGEVERVIEDFFLVSIEIYNKK
jgi:hypothetical protein